MKLTKRKKILLEALITLQLINYMVGTIILKDIFLVKYLRDAIVVVLLFEIARDRSKKKCSLEQLRHVSWCLYSVNFLV